MPTSKLTTVVLFFGALLLLQVGWVMHSARGADPKQGSNPSATQSGDAAAAEVKIAESIVDLARAEVEVARTAVEQANVELKAAQINEKTRAESLKQVKGLAEKHVGDEAAVVVAELALERAKNETTAKEVGVRMAEARQRVAEAQVKVAEAGVPAARLGRERPIIIFISH